MLNLWMKWIVKNFEMSRDSFHGDGVTIVNLFLFFGWNVEVCKVYSFLLHSSQPYDLPYT